MKRVRRILFNTLTAVSLLLAIATAGLWMRQLFVRDYLFREASLDDWQALVSRNGTITLLLVRSFPERRQRWVEESAGGEPLVFRAWPMDGHFKFDQGKLTPLAPARYWRVQIPLWFSLLFWSALPGWRLHIYTRTRDRFAGRCPACGYDTRANPAKCSECGHEIAAKAAVATKPS